MDQLPEGAIPIESDQNEAKEPSLPEGAIPVEESVPEGAIPVEQASANPSQYETPMQQGITALEGAARGATFGLSTKV